MKIIVVRHGQTKLNSKHLINGWIDDVLTKDGLRQAKEASKKIPKGIDIIYSSDLKRALDTAKILNKKLDLKIVPSVNLREINFGSLEGKFFSNDLIIPHRSMKYNWHPYGGESFGDVKKRLLKFLKKIRKDNKKVLIVTHGGIIRLLYHLQNKKSLHFIENVSFHKFDLDKILNKV